MCEYKTIDYQQGILEYGGEDVFLNIINKFINMTFLKQLKELNLGMQLMDQKRIEKSCFVLKGSVGQILAFTYLAKTNLLYETVKRSPIPRDQDIIDIYHRYFDLIDDSILLATELQVISNLDMNLPEIQSYKDGIWATYFTFLQNYVKQYSQPGQNNQRCQQCNDCNMF